MEQIIVTGGLGFIGTNLLKYLAGSNQFHIHNIDNFSLGQSYFDIALPGKERERVTHYRADINDVEVVSDVLRNFNIKKVFHLAAESHVDRSISGPNVFFESNVIGTLSLVEACREYINAREISDFRFVHVSTDEVFGDLDENDPVFDESSPYSPNSPYAVSKASSDMIIRAWGRTYGFPGIITNCSNNFGPYQNAEKFIPTILSSLLNNRRIPVYGTGNNIRDWLFVRDHVAMLVNIMNFGKLHQSYCLGGRNEISNLKLIRRILAACQKRNIVDQKDDLEDWIEFIDDRPGHDWRYAINSEKYMSIDPEFTATDMDDALDETISFYSKLHTF